MRSTITGLVACAAACGVICLGSGRPAPDPETPAAIVVAAGPCEEISAITRRTAAKEEVFDRLIASRLRLGDAVGEILGLNQEWPPLMPYHYCDFPGRSIAERVARSVIAAVELRLAGDPRREEVLGRLAAELGEVAAAGDGPAASTVVFVD